MKILMVNKFLYPRGGAETYMLQLGQYLQEQGHEVEYFGMDDPARTVGNRWNLYTASMDFHRNTLLQKAWYLTKIVYSKEARQKMYQLLNLFQPDVVHINNFNFQLTPSILLAAEDYRKQTKASVRVIYTAHDFQLVCPNHLLFLPETHRVCQQCLDGNMTYCLKNKCIHNSLARSTMGVLEHLFWKQRRVYRVLDNILCPSEFMRRKLNTNPLLADKTIFLRNFVSMPTSVAAQKGEYVLFFGRFSEEKGIRTLVEACRKLPHIPFVFAGGGPLEDLLVDIPNVRNVGFLNGEKLHAVIRNARFSVCTSQCHDNCPFSVMESIMYGTPVLGSDKGGIPELIQEGRTGWISPAEDAAQLTAAISRIWDSTEPEDYSENCVQTRFTTLSGYVEDMMKVYQGGMLNG